MVQNKKKYILGISAAIILFLMILLRVAVWGEFIQKKLNEKITSTGWSIDVGSSSGTLFGTMLLQNISLSHQDGSQILIKKSSINFGHIESFFGEIT